MTKSAEMHNYYADFLDKYNLHFLDYALEITIAIVVFISILAFIIGYFKRGKGIIITFVSVILFLIVSLVISKIISSVIHRHLPKIMEQIGLDPEDEDSCNLAKVVINYLFYYAVPFIFLAVSLIFTIIYSIIILVVRKHKKDYVKLNCENCQGCSQVLSRSQVFKLKWKRRLLYGVFNVILAAPLAIFVANPVSGFIAVKKDQEVNNTVKFEQKLTKIFTFGQGKSIATQVPNVINLIYLIKDPNVSKEDKKKIIAKMFLKNKQDKELAQAVIKVGINSTLTTKVQNDIVNHFADNIDSRYVTKNSEGKIEKITLNNNAVEDLGNLIKNNDSKISEELKKIEIPDDAKFILDVVKDNDPILKENYDVLLNSAIAKIEQNGTIQFDKNVDKTKIINLIKDLLDRIN